MYRVLYTLLLSACATSGSLGHDREPAPRARVTFAPLANEDTVRVVPHATEPMLPTADRLARVIANRLGERATVGIRYCVSSAGKLVSAELARPSSLPLFDHAVMRDIIDWQFAPQPGPAHVRTCQSATIVYRPPV